MQPNPQKLRNWSHLLENSLMENFIFQCVVLVNIAWLETLTAIIRVN